MQRLQLLLHFGGAIGCVHRTKHKASDDPPRASHERANERASERAKFVPIRLSRSGSASNSYASNTRVRLGFHASLSLSSSEDAAAALAGAAFLLAADI